MLLRATNPWEIPLAHRSSYLHLCHLGATCMYVTVSPNCGEFRRYGFSRRNSYVVQFSVAALWVWGSFARWYSWHAWSSVLALLWTSQLARSTVSFCCDSASPLFEDRFLQGFETVTSWEHCIDHNTTSARLSQLGWHASQGSERKFPSSSTKTNQEPPKHKSFRLSVTQLQEPKLRSDDLEPLSDYLDRHTHPSPSEGATHVPLPFASCSIFRAPQRVCHGSRRTLQVNCPEIPHYLGLMFESSTHCPDCRTSIPFLLLSKPKQSALALLFSHGLLQLTALCSSF